MSYEYTSPTLNIIGEGRFAGLEIKMEAIEVGVLLDMDENTLTTLITKFGEYLIDWNMKKAGKPLPPTLEGLRQIDLYTMKQLVQMWRAAMEGPKSDSPLQEDSDSGKQSVAASIPMETLSESHAS